ncbi:MAG: hypothetical protein ACKO13_14510, partial [Cytophagales bacterium]
SAEAERKLESMLYFDVNNGIARRAWARNPHAMATIARESKIMFTEPHLVDHQLLNQIVR